MTITSPHNETLKEIRKLAGRKWRDKLRQFVAEGEDLLAAADAAGWEPLARLVAEGSGLDGEEVKPHLLAQVSQLGSGTRALGVYGQRWAASRPARCAWRCGESTTPATSAPRCGAPWRSARAASRSGLARPTRTGRRPCAPRWAHCSRCRWRACARCTSCRAGRSRWWRTVARRSSDVVGGGARGAPPTRASRADVSIVVGAEREGLPDDVVAACDAVATIPVRAESLNAAMAATVALYECNRRMAAR